MNIYFEVENFNREMESRLLMGIEAASNGHQVYISDRVSILKNAEEQKIESGVIFLKDANSSDEFQNILSNIKKANFTIISTDEEAGIQFNDYEDFIKIRSLRKFENIDIFICWGLRDKKILKKKFPNNKTKFLALGSARLDLCKKQIFLKKKSNNKNEKINKKYILISSNISYPIGIRPLPEFIGSRVADDRLDASFREKFYYYKYINNTIRCYHLVKLLRKLLNEFPNFNFILRPHPNETKEAWEKILVNKYENLTINKSGSLADYIFSSELLIHTGCTSGIEAALMGKKSISFVPQKFDFSIEGDFADKISKICIDEKEVINTIKNIENLKVKNFQEFKSRIINPFFSKSFKKINFLFNKLEKKHNYKNINCDKVFKKNTKPYRAYFKEFILKVLGIKKYVHPFNIKFPELNYQEVNILFSQLVSLDKKYSNIFFEIQNDTTIKIFRK